MAQIATLAHISDLHFIEDLTEEGRRQWSKSLGTKSHSYNKLRALARRFFEIQEIQGNEIDMLLVTGDVSTDGAEGSLRTARAFFEKDDIYTFPHKPDAEVGLAANPHQWLVIPGNHDRYAGGLIPLQRPSTYLESVFPQPSSYPYVVGYRRNSNDTAKQGTPALLFFVFDSTLNQRQRADLWNHVARGRIEQEVCDRLGVLAETIRRTGQVPSLSGSMLDVDYERAIRIGILHHHPIPDPARHRLVDDLELTVLENSPAFLGSCFDAEIDLVLFGHQHRKYEDLQVRQESVGSDGRKTYEVLGAGKFYDLQDLQVHQMRFFCCPSTSEYSETDNGFQIIDFDRSQYTVHSYIWNGDRNWRGDSFDLSRSTPYPFSGRKLQKFATAR